jgi:hypothetical protein
VVWWSLHVEAGYAALAQRGQRGTDLVAAGVVEAEDRARKVRVSDQSELFGQR